MKWCRDRADINDKSEIARKCAEEGESLTERETAGLITIIILQEGGAAEFSEGPAST